MLPTLKVHTKGLGSISIHHTLLNVNQPSLKAEVKEVTTLIDSPSGNLYGAQVGSKAVIFSRGPEMVSKGTYKVPNSGLTWQLLCNLKPGKTYRILLDGVLIHTAQASSQGTIQFAAQTATKQGLFEIRLTE